jgi:hypothetical protein
MMMIIIIIIMTQMEIIHCKEKPKQEEGKGPTTPAKRDHTSTT